MGMTLYTGGGYVYFDLLFLVIFLTFFIPCWVFFFLGWQVSIFKGISILEHEKGTLEFFWTSIPTLSVAGMCMLNLQLLIGEPRSSLSDVVKVVGRQ